MSGRISVGRRAAVVELLSGALGLFGTEAVFGQQNYPSRPVRVIVPFSPGGTVDVVVRTIAPGWSEVLGRPFIVENRAGAGGVVGADNVAKSPPDGYSLLAFHVGLTYGKGLFKKLPYDVERDLQPVSLLGVAPSILVVTPSFKAKTVAELIQMAKRQPGALNYASAGNGASSHLAVELLQKVAGIKLTHVPYRGGAPALTAVMAGDTQLMIETSASVLPQVKSGKLRALAVTGEHRLAELPNVPTMREAGTPGYLYTTWFGLWAPTGTPRAIVDQLNRATYAALAKPAVKDGLLRAGIEPRASSVPELEKLVHSDLEKWTHLIQDAGIQPE